MYTVSVKASQAYEVHIGTGLLEQVGSVARTCAGGTKALIVTDSNVGPLYAGIVSASLEAADYACTTYTFLAGEAQKYASTYLDILDTLARSQLSRDDLVVAVGGGVTGDLAGFAAATYLRGINYIQVPTSLLAQVDSSVGGKCGIDLEQGKNLAGAFWQPRAVLADVGCLATLTPEVFSDGCGEIIKHAVLADPELFQLLHDIPLSLDVLHANIAGVAAVIARSIEIKRNIVEADEREAGARALLNLGHSIGHAIEHLEAYQRGHGSCVAAGMVAIARAAAASGACEEDVPTAIDQVSTAMGLDTSIAWGAEAIFKAALSDKKRHADTITLVIPHAIGTCALTTVALKDFYDIIASGIRKDA
ncbi:3-dehydroquinate synthase [Collinsella sp. AGMB00827]|uniref:3-dehydroquinate synthase n=1 Tax=Collinsella ureilytica TaxID=2869515 RepID=A0ABS7ML33_9ACTN|nr:3-dehydroquinate synthase [Collinsella urealyticum]MBY4798078.1 3-dehydroquinate synthase [Collinsella urealyticum]